MEAMAAWSLAHPVNPQVLSKQAFAGATFVANPTAIKAETLLIHGAEDRIVPVANARKLVAALANAKLQVISPAGHACHIDAAETVANSLLQFLK